MSAARANPDLLDDDSVQSPTSSALAIPTNVIPKSEWNNRAQLLIDTLLSRMSSVEALILIKQINEITGVALGSHKDIKLEKNIIESAMLALEGTQQEIAGAAVKMKSKAAEYIYEDSELDNLQIQADEIKGKIKARQQFLQNLKADTVLPGGEEVKKAKCVAAGATLSVTFPK